MTSRRNACWRRTGTWSIYGAAGHIGSAVARAFAREGAQVFLTGRTLRWRAAGRGVHRGRRRSCRGGAGGRTGRRTDRAPPRRCDAACRPHRRQLQCGVGSAAICKARRCWRCRSMTSCCRCRLGRARSLPSPPPRGTSYGRQARRGVILTLSASTVGLSGRDRVFHRTGGFGSACAAIEDLSRRIGGRAAGRAACAWSACGRTRCPKPGHRFRPTCAHAWRRLGPRPAADLARSGRRRGDRWPATAPARSTGTIANLTCGSIMDPH